VLMKNFPRRHAPDRDAAVDASSGRHVGRIHLRMERAADRLRPWSKAARTATSAMARRGASRAKRSAWSATRTRRTARLGLETSQLNRDFAYTQNGAHGERAHATLSHIGLLSPPMHDFARAPAMPDPADTTRRSIERRAYLHTNCSQCHRPDGPTPSTMDLRYTTALNATNACNAVPHGRRSRHRSRTRA
jgi:mono/diheme cytochrome c family protein